MEPGLFYHEIPHFILTVIIAGAFYWKFRDWRLVLTCFLMGILIDVDHLFDFWAYSGVGSNIFKMFSYDYFRQSQKVYVLLHGWEFLPFWWLIGRYLNQRLKIKGLEWALTIAYFGHLLVDQFSGYTSNLFAYSLIYRILIKFDLGKFNGL